MLEELQQLPQGVRGVRATGTVTTEDYERVLKPMFDQARSHATKTRFLYHFPPSFERFSPGAAWQDLRLGLRYLRRFERCAIVSDVGWIRDSARWAGMLMPCPVQVFDEAAFDEAVTWLSGPAEAKHLSHRLLADEGVLVVEIKGKLSPEDFDALALTVDPWLESHGTLNGVVFHTLKFPGWEHAGAFFRHMQFVRDHHQKVKRVAFAADGMLPDIARTLAEQFSAAEVKHFGSNHVEDAIAWAGGNRPSTKPPQAEQSQEDDGASM